MVAHTIGEIIYGNMAEPEVIVNASPFVGGLLDSLTGSIGISSRAKPVAAPVASSTPSNTSVGAVSSDALKVGSRPLNKDALRTYISSSMPFGTPLDLNASNIFSIKVNGFSSADLPPADVKQPAWKPYLYKVNCRAKLEGLPDVSLPLTGLNGSHIESLSFHPFAQVPEPGADKQSLMFSPPLGNFVLMHYQASCGLGPPIKEFYQLSMVSEDERAFLFRLSLMEGCKAPLTKEFCTLTMPFPRRRIIAVDGTPSVGTISTAEHSVEWKLLVSGRGLVGKSIEATFPGTVKFAPWQIQRLPFTKSFFGSMAEENSDVDREPTNNMVIVEEFLMGKMTKDLPPVDLEEPFCWRAYNYAKVSFRIAGASLSGISVDPKSVSFFPTTC
ncbi:hypothetical protein EUGRSUZ_B01191 [Eucalyptus grandis]|uniref:Uncharacterized protein n=2 Tax=Eucalyptus grandis TaxID=71139 RepID=A0ACC3LQ41_EUCGR|nr:hypothetical protein EUGRSUZ_B01191 [Eucalyptus grandis]